MNRAQIRAKHHTSGDHTVAAQATFTGIKTRQEE
jgi:hypothetical protein